MDYKTIFILASCLHFNIFHSTKGVKIFRNAEALLPFLQPDDIQDGRYDSLNPVPSNLCTRQCQEDEPPRVCYYQFTIEQFTAMGYACGDCPTNLTACYSPQCVTGDGTERMLLTVNRRLPGPSIQVCKGDTIVVDVANHLSGRSTSLHWHGMRQTGTPFMDGMPMITQCPILPNQIFRYKFKAQEAGTSFWHSHSGVQKMDGIIGSLIVRQPRSKDLNTKLYDKDLPSHVMMITDWMHRPMDDVIPGLLKTTIGQRPDSYIINGRGNYMPSTDPNLNITHDLEAQITPKPPVAIFTVKSGLKYRFRAIAGTCLSCPLQFFIQNHKLQLIGADLDSVEPVMVDSITIASGERFDFVINAVEPASTYWIFMKGLGSCGGRTGVGLLKYDSAITKPISSFPGETGFPSGVVLNPRNSACQNNSREELCVTQLKSRYPNIDGLLKPIPDNRFVLRFAFFQFKVEEAFNDNYQRIYMPYNPFINEIPILTSYVNNVSLSLPPAPLLTQMNDIPPSVFCSSTCAKGSPTYCECLNVIKARLGSTVEFLFVNDNFANEVAISHPFHIHGYEFSITEIGVLPTGFRPAQIQAIIERLEANPINRTNIIRKDTINVPAFGYAVVRLVANNPGVWFLHCHFINHSETGMSIIFQVGEPEDFPAPPPDFPKCNEFLSMNADPL